ncbi:MAG: PAS domain S-box protein [Bacteroidales bacterium]|nr:PAS domain S-box protein [Bacteroidales bacterium]
MPKNQNVEDKMSRDDLLRQIPGFLKNSPVGTHFYEILNDQLIFRGGNFMADQILQTDHRKLIGKTIESAFPGLEKTDIPRIYKEIAVKGTSWNSDEVQYHINDGIHYFKVSAFQTLSGNMIAMFSDITDLKNSELVLKLKNEELLAAEEGLRESEEKFRIAFKTSPDSVNINRLADGMYIEINEGFTHLTGYTWEDVKGKTSSMINIWHNPADRQRMVDALKSNGKVVNLEAKFRLKNGEVKTGLMSASFFKLRNEVYVMSVTRDIEEIVQARATIRESDERFSQLAENIDDVFWLSEGNRILYLNSALERTFGFKSTSVIQNINNLGKVIYPEDLPVYDELTSLRRSGKTEPVFRQLRIIDPAGKIRWIWARLFPILDENNQLFRIAGMVSDITLQKEIENELRTAKEKAQESDHLKSAFLANLSHEIRTPMNGILGFSNLITRDDADAEMKNQYVEIIHKSSDQLLHIIDDLVDISKIEANQMRIIKQECRLNHLLDDLHLFYQQLLKQNEKTSVEISKHYVLSGDDSVIITDEFRLRQILMNLLSNAVKFTHKGHIRFGYTLEKKNLLRFFVEDTGIGIEKDHTEVIFQPFRQADYNNTREYEGTGLGLSISRGLVKLLDGSLELKSNPGKGSTFYFTIPYQPVRPPEDNGGNALNETDLHWNGRSVLIVEDDEINFRYLQEILAPTGLRIILACNGVQALEEFSTNNPDLVIMDIRLPQMNGLDAARKIRQEGSTVPIIAQTAYAMMDDKNACFEAGCDDYVAKPIQREVLLGKIAFHLKKVKADKTI